MKAARIKAEGDQLLKEASEPGLRGRISVTDATTSALALRFGASLVAGDRDLRYVADRIGVKIVW